MRIIYKWGTPLLAAGCLVILARIWTRDGLTDLILTNPSIQSFKILFISIILEAFPFILLGVLFSALLQVFVSDKMIARLTPKNPVVGVLFGSLLGLLLPLCECGMIPVVRRLIRKGMPAYIGLVFIFAGPIINPVVFTSTFTAFRSEPLMAYSRMGLTFVVCVLLGLLLYRFLRKNPLRSAHPYSIHHHHEHSHNHSEGRNGLRGRISATFAHASDEFFDIGKYLIMGAFITAALQTALDRQLLDSITDQPFVSHIFMMVLAFALSLCSTSDAFVASSFSGLFSPGALLAFLVFGPMVDLKSTLMLFSAFRTKVVLTIIAFLFVAVLMGSMVMEKLVFYPS
ncbi:permease [Paenibacillus sepulcri]|uniref:Permease n=1 Tax=Paenibacillus sepulcri TaxID=359917 RepID=A0ABS7BXP6_9BACL|nr:permease [Paenibacillus sepulcri]